MRGLLLVAMLVAGAARADDPPTFTIAVGRVNATDDEGDQCYFNVGYGDQVTLVSFHLTQRDRLTRDLGELLEQLERGLEWQARREASPSRRR